VVTDYSQLIRQVDELTARLSSRYAQHLVCRAGCSGCCHHHLSVFPVEAESVRQAIEALPEMTRGVIEKQARDVIELEAQDKPVACPLLVENRCSIYESRPMICRTQGLPLLLVSEEGELEVDFCPLNFAEPGATDDLDEDHLVPLEDLNFTLAMVNLQHCRKVGIADEESGQRQPIADIILKSKV